MRPTVSLAFMCGDAQRDFVGRMLRSFATFPYRLIDEIVFGWNGTGEAPDDARAAAKEIAARHGTTPLHTFAQRWVGDFSRSRNEAFDRTTGDWIFWIDCDDEIANAETTKATASANRKTVATLARPLAELLADTHPDITALWLPYDYARDEPIQLHPRILRRDAGYRWEGRVQEEIVATKTDTPIWTEYWGLLVRQEAVETNEARQARNVPLLEATVAGGDRNPVTLHYLAKAREDAGRYAEAVSLYRESCVSAAKDRRRKSRRYLTAGHGLFAALGAKDYGSMIDFARIMIEARPDLHEAWNAMGVAFACAEQRKNAREAFELADRSIRAGSHGRPRFVLQPELDVDSEFVTASRASVGMG